MAVNQITLNKSDKVLTIDTEVNHGIGHFFKVNRINKDGKPSDELPIKLSISRIHYKKAIYKYGFIDIELTADNVSEISSTFTRSLKSYFFNTDRTVSLVEKDKAFIEGYYLTDMSVRQETIDGNTVAIATLKAYSPDYFLTLHKYSKVYRGKRLSAIIKSTLKDTFGSSKDDDKLILEDRFTAKYLCHTTDKNGNELKQPYLVQYNETFHDFVVRTANRCGELFYYEDGKLILGADEKNLDISADGATIDILNKGDLTDSLPKELVFSHIPSPFIKTVKTLGKSYLITSTADMEMADKKSLYYNQNIEYSDALRTTSVDDDSITASEINDSHWLEIIHKGLASSGISNLITSVGSKAIDIGITGSCIAKGFCMDEKSKPGIQSCEADLNNNFHTQVARLKNDTDLTKAFKERYESAHPEYFTKSKDVESDAFKTADSSADKALKAYIAKVKATKDIKRNHKETKKAELKAAYKTKHSGANDLEFKNKEDLTDAEIFDTPNTKGYQYIQNYIEDNTRDMTPAEIAQWKTDYEASHDIFKNKSIEEKENIWSNEDGQPWKDLQNAKTKGVAPSDEDIKAQKEQFKKEYPYDCVKYIAMTDEQINAKLETLINDPSTDLGRQFQQYMDLYGKKYDEIFDDEKVVEENEYKDTFKNKTTDEIESIWKKHIEGENEAYNSLLNRFKDKYKKQHPGEFKSKGTEAMSDKEKQKVWDDSSSVPAKALKEYLQVYQDESNFSNMFYSWIEGNEKIATESIQVHTLSENKIPEHKLGEYYTLPNEDDKLIYLVNQVEVDIVSNPNERTHKINASITLSNTVKDQKRATMEKDYQQQTFPPLADIPHIRKAEPQIAIITDVADPQRAGRVQITYPWANVEKAYYDNGDPIMTPKDKNGENKETKSASPWIPVAVPFVGGADSGFLMTPDKDDLVMVNYEGGNIERPYVDGSLFHGKASTYGGKSPMIAKAQNYRGTKHAISYKGNSISFVPGSANQFVGSMLPSALGGVMMKFPEKFGAAAKVLDGSMRLGGGITLTDYYGTYNISMSSSGRSVDIESPWGKVGISAFTGITLSAPNGDIKIEGKNVTIEAGNNIKMVSGKNIKSKHVNWAQEIANTAAKLAGAAAGSLIKNSFKTKVGVDLGKAVDLSFVRSVWEVVVRPVEGSLSLNSKRNLMLEAGGGKVITPSDTLSKTPKTKKGGSLNMFKSMNPFSSSDEAETKAKEEAAIKGMKLLDSLGKHYFATIDTYVSLVQEYNKSFANSMNKLVQFYLPSDGKEEDFMIKKDGYTTKESLINVIQKGNHIDPVKDKDAEDWIKYPVWPEKVTKRGKKKDRKTCLHRLRLFITDLNLIIDQWKALKKQVGIDCNENLLTETLKMFNPDTDNYKKIFGMTEATLSKDLPNSIGTKENINNIFNFSPDNYDCCLHFTNEDYTKDAENAKKVFKKLAYSSIVYYSDRFSIWEKNALGITVKVPKTKPNHKNLADPVKWKNFLATVFLDKKESKDGFSVSSLANSFLSGAGLGDLVSYDDSKDEWTLFGGVQKALNFNGKSGPRALWDVSSKRGAILMSGRNGATYCIGREEGLKKIENPTLEDTYAIVEKL